MLKAREFAVEHPFEAMEGYLWIRKPNLFRVLMMPPLMQRLLCIFKWSVQNKFLGKIITHTQTDLSYRQTNWTYGLGIRIVANCLRGCIFFFFFSFAPYFCYLFEVANRKNLLISIFWQYTPVTSLANRPLCARLLCWVRIWLENILEEKINFSNSSYGLYCWSLL